MWLSVSRVISLILLFLAYTQLFRYLGPEQSGQFQFVLSYVTLFGVVIDFGIQQYIIKKTTEDRSKAKLYFHNFLMVEIILAIIVYGTLLLIAYLNNYEPIVFKAIMVAGFGTALHGMSYPFLAVITSFYDLKKAAFLNFLSSVINVGIIFITIWCGFSIVFLTIQQGIYAILAITLYYQFVKKFIGKPEIIKGFKEVKWSLVKTILRASLPFALLVGFSTIYNRIDVVLITKFLGYTQTGFYTAAYKFYDLIAFFPAVVSHSLYPVFSTLMAEKNLIQVRKSLEKYLRVMSALALPMATGGMLLSEPLIRILAGEEFVPAAKVLSVLVWAPAILFVYIVVNALVISQLTKFATLITGTNVVINIIGNLILLPRVGVVGAAIMTIVSESLQGLFYFYFVRKHITKFHFFRNFWQPFLASGIMGIVVYLLRDQFVLIPVIVGAIVYGLMLLMFGFFKREDYEFVKSFMLQNYESIFRSTKS
jgi:O-antigen/teichoic acid export membrane protein